MHFSKPVFAIGVLFVLLGVLRPSPVAAQPAWFVQDMQQMVGSWRADNSEFLSEAEPFDAYQIDWTWGLGERSLHGVLVGVRDGHVVDTFWTMHRYWNPADRAVQFFQIGGDGTIGVGEEMLRPNGVIYVEQEFSSPAASAPWTVIHEAVTDGGEHVTSSFDVDANGSLTPRRTYTWLRRSL